MSVTTKLMTAADLEALDDDAPFELIRGELREVPPPKPGHGLIAGQFAIELGIYGRTIVAGVVLIAEAGLFAEHDPDTVVAPDVSFIRSDRLPPEEELKRTYLLVPPEAVVEVVSPSNRRREIEEKIAIYFGFGVLLVIVAKPETQKVELHFADGTVQILGMDDILDGGEALPGFRVPVSQFFA